MLETEKNMRLYRVQILVRADRAVNARHVQSRSPSHVYAVINLVRMVPDVVN